MRLFILAAGLFTVLPFVNATPRAYRLPPLFDPPRPVPSPGVTVPSSIKARQAPVTACAADVDRLASGIQQNILDQQGELATAQELLQFLQSANGTRKGISAPTPGNSSTPASSPDKNVGQFMALKAQLLAFVTAGIAIRSGNQAIAPSGSLASGGLAQVCSPKQNL